MDYYKCEDCGKAFDEFEMDFKAAQEDKKTLCKDCRSQNYNAVTPEFDTEG